MITIVKVQTPLSGPGPALIYDQAREHTVQRQLYTHEVDQMKGEAKAYFRAEWSGPLGWGLGIRVEDQDW